MKTAINLTKYADMIRAILYLYKYTQAFLDNFSISIYHIGV